MDASLVVGELSCWPDAEVRRAYRLVTATIATRQMAGTFGLDDDDRDLAADAEMYGIELVHRDLI